MADQNPYESPKQPGGIVSPPAVIADVGPKLGHRALLLLSVLTAIASFIFPPVALLVLLLLPAALRYVRLRNIRRKRGESLDQTEAMMLFGACTVVAIPIMLASVVAFCCVCAPGAAVGQQIFVGPGGNASYGGMIIGGYLLIVACGYVALLFGQALLRKFNYLSKEKAVSTPTDDT